MADHRLTTLISSIPADKTYFSLEFFPPKTQPGFTNLQARLNRMTAGLRPLFVTVTWGAGGSTASKSLELAEVCQRQLGIPTVLHLTCTNMRKQTVDEALQVCKELGVRNILALRGDPPREEYRDESSEEDTSTDFVWAIDLVRYIRKTHGDYFCIGVAGYPEGHADESHPEPGKQSVERDLPYLVKKVKAGANFIMTQLTYDIDAYGKYEERVRAEEGLQQIPIIPGLMPMQSYSIVTRITKLSHAKLPPAIAMRIEQVKGDDEKVKIIGVDVLTELVEAIQKLPQPKGLARGIHFYTLNLERSVAMILRRCGLIPAPSEESFAETSDSDAVVDSDKKLPNGGHSPRFSRRRASSVNNQAHNRVVIDGSRSPPARRSDSKILAKHEALDKSAGVPAAPKPTPQQALEMSQGYGSMGREATWDDFVNGRWGPATSAAYGEINGYSTTLQVGPATARKLWGHPKNASDITDLFRRHVLGDVEAIPWSDEIDQNGGPSGSSALRAETSVIKEQLLALIEKGYWTVASQPAVDGARSDDDVFGWGPKGEGFVFAKPFVEFWTTASEWETQLRPKLIETDTEDFSWMKIDVNGFFESTETVISDCAKKQGKITSKRTPGTSGVNSVTWGVFRSKEVISPTIIEPESFKAWSEEAFAIWHEWRRCFPKGSEEEMFLEKMRKECVLVNVVGQKYVGDEGMNLWKLLRNDSI
jgi:methylenetetrahydrofolate reductase (NADPH)